MIINTPNKPTNMNEAQKEAERLYPTNKLIIIGNIEKTVFEADKDSIWETVRRHNKEKQRIFIAGYELREKGEAEAIRLAKIELLNEMIKEDFDGSIATWKLKLARLGEELSIIPDPLPSPPNK